MNDIQQKAIHYKRKVAGSFMAITQEDISFKISGDKVYITTKIDGEFNLLHFDGKQSMLVNGSGKIKDDLPLLKSATKSLKDQKIKSLSVACELHLSTQDHRSRVFEVMSAISKKKDSLTVSPFDIVALDGEDYAENDYQNTIEKLTELFKNNDEINPVYFQSASSSGVKEIYEEIVANKGAEGLVVRFPDMPIVYKIKPLHTIDASVIGFTEGDEKKVREILFALQNEDDSFVQFGRTGNGLSEDEKADLYKSLSKDIIESSYIEADGRRVAFQMVKPIMVVEISVNELLTENTKGIIKNHLLNYDEKNGYSFSANIDGVSLIHPVFKRIRDDKQVNNHDVRFSQVTDIVYLEHTGKGKTKALPESEIIFREVYTKASKGNTNVQKFIAWKTNKEKSDDGYPAFVMNYTNFSPTRKDPLKKDVRISNSKKQIMELVNGFMENNIKKGWEKVL
jgi:ATP-dependent DNA ligase|tara:strand:- start:149 stop:1507 length:1359 start_codon:yes stop_codon:yes gene_type:complete